MKSDSLSFSAPTTSSSGISVLRVAKVPIQSLWMTATSGPLPAVMAVGMAG